jgi:hypothetical protein
MSVIFAPNIDSKFWNIELLAVDILKSIEKTDQAVIHFNREGPAFAETNLYNLFQYLKDSHNVDLSKITILTGNLIEDTTQEYKVNIYKQWLYEFPVIKLELPKYSHALEKNSIAKKFGIFIGRSNHMRLALAGHMFSNHRDNTLLTYHYESSSDYHKNHLGLEELIHKFGPNSDIIKDSIDLIRASPILKEETRTYPLGIPECLNILSWYNQFYVEIVCETYFRGEVFFPTEKTWRALAMKTPFIVQGPSFFLKRLKKIGFKTFSNWWDESYDEDPDDYKLTSILRVIDEINCLDMEQVYKEMQPILEHNHELFRKLNFNSFNEILNE